MPRGDRLNEFQTQGGETVDEITVGAKLENCPPVALVEFIGFSVLDELEGILTKLRSVADCDV